MNDAEFGKRFRKAFSEVVAEPDLRFEVFLPSGNVGLPRSSGIFSCARQQLFSLTKTPKTEMPDAPSEWAAAVGFAGERLAEMTLTAMGYTVGHPEMAHDVTSGHLDGDVVGLDLEEPHVWDNKMRGAYSQRMLYVQGMREYDPQMFGQMQDYLRKTKLKRAMITVIPQSFSAAKREFKWNKLDADDVFVQRYWVDADPKAQDIAVRRAEDLLTAQDLGLMVHREFNPASRAPFPCPYCPWLAKCFETDLEYSTKRDEIMTVTPLGEYADG